MMLLLLHCVCLKRPHRPVHECQGLLYQMAKKKKKLNQLFTQVLLVASIQKRLIHGKTQKPNTQCKLMALRLWWASSSQGYSLPGFPAVNVAMGRSFFCVSCQNERLLSSVWHLTLLLSDTTSMSHAPPNKTVVFVGGSDMPFSPHYSIFNHKTGEKQFITL